MKRSLYVRCGNRERKKEKERQRAGTFRTQDRTEKQEIIDALSAISFQG